MKLPKLLTNSLIIYWFKQLYIYFKRSKPKVNAWDNISNLLTELVSEQVRIIEENALFKSVLNIGNVYIVDIATNTILYANDRLKSLFGKDIEGKICHEVLQGHPTPCEFCTNDIIAQQEGEPYYWVYFNPKTNEVYIIADVYVKLKANGNTAHVRFEIAIPINETMQIDLAKAWKKKQ